MKTMKSYTPKASPRIACFVLAIFLAISASSCIESLDSDGSGSGRPIGTQQILITLSPDAVFGNACEFVDVLALFNELLTPDGATIQVNLTGSALPPNLRGCIASFDPVVVDGMAMGKYLGPPLLGIGDFGFVNIALTSKLQSGAETSSFVTVVIQGVGIVEPITGPTMITSNPNAFATIQVETIGIPPGTVVTFTPTNPACGFTSNPTPVVGSVFDGLAIAQYNPVVGTACTQTVIVRIVLPNPPTKDPNCPSIPLAERTIQASITFDQVMAPPPTPAPERCGRPT